MSSLRVRLVGRGRWGRTIERTLLAFPGVTLTVVGRGAVPSQDLDAVIVATPGASHADVALPYIERRIPTFIEKPMAASLADAERIAAAARLSGTLVFVGHIHLYNPAFTALLELLPTLGGIRYVLCEGMNDAPASTASVLWEWLPHHLSMGRAILAGEPSSVEAWSLSGPDAPQAVISRFLFGKTPLVSVASWLSPGKRRQLTVSCERGTAVFDDAAERKLVLHGADGAISHPPYAAERPLTLELAAFLDAARRGETDRDHIAESTAIVRQIAGAERALNQGQAVTL